MRCVKMKFECDGYPKPKQTPNEARGLAPRSLKGLVPKAPAVERSLLNYKFASQQEYLSFQMFCRRTMFDLVGGGDKDAWNRVVIQACEYQDSIRDAVIAIGALNYTLEGDQQDQDQHIGLLKISQSNPERHRFALQKYGSAIGQMRRDMDRGEYNMRTTLISCILVVFFEFFQGNHTAGMIHASAGLELIKERKSSPQESRAGSPDNVDESLAHIFMRLDRLNNPFSLNSLFKVQGEVRDELEDTPPTVFTTCREARQAWDSTARKISQSMDFLQSRTSGNSTDSFTSASSQAQTPNNDRNKPWEVDLTFTRTIGDQIYPQLELEQLLQWYTAFQPLFNESRRSKDAQFRHQAAFLQKQHHISFIALTSAQWDDELQYDNFTPLFQETLSLSQELLDEQRAASDKSRPIFTFDTGVIGFLWVVATKCRHSEIRWKAVNLLLEHPIREGIWTSAVTARGAEAIIRLEERGVEGAVIPEEARVRAEGVSLELISRKALLTYSRLARFGEFTVGKRIRERVEVFW